MNSEGTRRDEIIKTAARLFKEKGYSAVTMRDLATAMGIKASSLYNHITSKQDILKAIIISLAEEFTGEMEIIKTSHHPVIDKLKLVIALHVKISVRNTYGMACLNNDWMHLQEQSAYYLQLRKKYEQDVVDMIKDGMSSKDIIQADPNVIMFSLLSTLRSLYLWLPKDEKVDTAELTTALSEILINGINK